jgi:hypothetical protein
LNEFAAPGQLRRSALLNLFLIDAMSNSTKLVARMGLACMVAAILSGILGGLWEMAHPILTTDTFASASGAQRWGYALLSVIRSVGFLAGLFGLYQVGTNRGWIVTILMGLATLGGVFFAAVWLYMAVIAQVKIVYVLGGLWYQWVAPIALGIASLRARRISPWVGIWAIVVGILNSQIFMLLGPVRALLVQGVIWFILGYMVYMSGRR